MPFKDALRAGLVASVAMGMIAMIYEAVAGAGFWAPVVFIAATILRDLQAVAVPVPPNVAGIVVGLAGHMMNSVILTLVFTRLVPSRESRMALVGAGVLFGVAVFVVMWYGVLPWLDPVMRRLNAPVFALAHVMWGAIVGLMLPLGQAESAGTMGTAPSR